MVIIPMQVYCTMNKKNEQYGKIRLKIVEMRRPCPAISAFLSIHSEIRIIPERETYGMLLFIQLLLSCLLRRGKSATSYRDSQAPTYKDEPSAHGRCELEARRSVHPERM